MHSSQLIILAGPNLTRFCVHSGLLTELSEETRRLVYTDVGEGVQVVKARVEMKEVPEETMAHFLEFCYTGDYDVHCEMGETAGYVARDVEDREEALAQARLYVFAKRYNIEALQELTLHNLGAFHGVSCRQHDPLPSGICS